MSAVCCLELGRGTPALHSLTLIATEPGVLKSLRGMVQEQPALRHLKIITRSPWPSSSAAVDDALALYRGLSPSLRSLDLSSMHHMLPLDDSRLKFLNRLPVMPLARRLVLSESQLPSVHELEFAAAARVCPYINTLVVGFLCPEIDNSAGAAALLNHFPSLHRLYLRDCGGWDVSLAFVAGICRGRSLDTLSLSRVGNGEHEADGPSDLTTALRAAAIPLAKLRLDHLLSLAQAKGLVTGALQAVRALHINIVVLDSSVCRALSGLAELRSLYLGAHRPYFADNVGMDLQTASVLAPPALHTLHFSPVHFLRGAATGLVTALSLSRP